MRNILLTIAYDGTNFSGWQRQPGKRTVCGELEAALERVCGQPVQLSGCSRTDAGVHALGQCASFELPDGGIPTERIAKAVNDLLAKDRLEGVGEIFVCSAREMPEGFHARYDAKGKRYRYRISNAPEKSIFLRTQCYQVADPLDERAMRRAAAYILGEHDFACFQSAGGTPRESTVREIFRLDIERRGDRVDIVIEGNGFLYNMVRIIAGTLVEVGCGRRSPESLKDTIASKDRAAAGHTAPPQGLYLEEVFYE